jgi:hypothetical protein
MSGSKLRLFKSVVYSAACVLLAAATMPAGIAAGVDPAQRFEAAPEIEGGATLNLPRSLAAKDQSVIVVARLAADPITVVQAKQGRRLTAAEKQQIRASLQGQQAALTSVSTRAGIPNGTSICRIISKASTSVSCLLFPGA